MTMPAHELLLIPLLLQLLLPASAADLPSPQALVMEDKIRLGSTPPGCHNRCNECNPCTAVQVPTLPARARAMPAAGRTATVSPPDGLQPADYNRYSNYKPLGWKCRCGGRLFNP